MDSIKIIVENVKCGGCVSNIENGLSSMDGVEAVSVDLSNGEVSISGSVARDVLVTKLTELGYPEAD